MTTHSKAAKSKITRRGLQIALGLLWLLDGLLQLQPRMFTADFARDVIAPAAAGQPGFVSGPMHFFMTLFLWHPALANAGIAAVQIGLAVLILAKPTARIGLWLSVAWGLFVWYVGEGLSGLASGHALMLMGSPGAALIYVILALGSLPPRAGTAGRADQRPAHWLVAAWAAIWLVGAAYQLLPGQNTVADNAAMVAANAEAAPPWLASVDNAAARWLNGLDAATAAPDPMAGMPGMGGMATPAAQNIGPSATAQTAAAGPTPAAGRRLVLLVALLQTVVAVAVFIPGLTRLLAVGLGCVLSLGYWVVGQSLGAYFSGVATDPSTGPLLILLGLAVLGCTQRDEAMRSYFARLKRSVVGEISAFNE